MNLISEDIFLSKRNPIEVFDEFSDSEKRIQEIADAMPQIVFTKKPCGTIDWHNSKWEEYVGKLSDGTKNIFSPLHPDDEPETLLRWNHSVSTGEDFEIEYRLRRHTDGVYRWFLGRASAIKDQENIIIKWIGTNTDINKTKLQIQHLKKERAIRERLVNALTHDLRTPLTVAKLAAQVQLRSRDPETMANFSDRIVDNMNRAEAMIVDLLDASRINAGEKICLKISESNIEKIIEEVIKDMSDLHVAKFIFENIAGSLTGHWDVRGLQRVMENLTGNAIKYGNPDSPITIRIIQIDNEIQISVQNEGSYIEPVDRANLFSQFSRNISSRDDNKTGWGIGLSLVKILAEAHFGHVWIESDKLLGTIFFLRLHIDARATR